MNMCCRNIKGNVFLFLFSVLFISLLPAGVKAQVINDSCSRATIIAVPAGGYGLGIFSAPQVDISSATIQSGETFAPAIFVAGLNKKSVWYKFSIPTIRAVRVTLTQPGTAITAGDVGFAVYKASSCIPGNAEISSKLTPIVTFGNTYHPCVPSGDYYIQVSSNNNANGPISIQVEISDQTGAAYDHPSQAYAFGQVTYYAQKIDFNSECQSIEDATEVCNVFSNKTDYNKSAWMTFKTPAYFDYIVVQLSGTGASTYFPSNNGLATKRTFGFTLYQGDAVTTPINSLATIDGCDSLQTDGYYAGFKMYKCSDLQPNTTYSIQLFIKKDFIDDIRMGVLVGGQAPSKGPKPTLTDITAPNKLGNLPASPNGTLTRKDDVWGCSSRHTNSCGPALPDSGILYTGRRFNLSSFFTFSLSGASSIYFSSYALQCGPQPLVRIFKQGVTNNCSDLDTSNILGVFNYYGTIDCLQPGDYTVQISGQDFTAPFNQFHYASPAVNFEQCLSTNLGTSFRLDMTVYTRKAANKYSLNIPAAFDSINDVNNIMQPLLPGIPYVSTSDTMGCANTLRPADTTCSPINAKVIYREFVVADSGVVDFSTLTNVGSPYNWNYRLYSGDAGALASAQNVSAYPQKINGLIAKTLCFDGYEYCENKRACVVPGTYTFTTMGGDPDVGRVDKPTFTFLKTRTKHNSPLLAQNLGSVMDTLGAGGGSIITDIDYWSCSDNAVPINGYQPCPIGGRPATKAIYRQFYLKEPALIRIDNVAYYYCYDYAFGVKTLFYGKATDGLAGLNPVGTGWDCFQSAGTTAGCTLLPQGWYTVVSYNQGPSYDSTMRSVNLSGKYNGAVSYKDEWRITITPTCPSPKYNRPYKASINNTTNQPHLITWANRTGHTAAYPKTDTVFTLPTENFNCLVDTPFTSHPIKACLPISNRVAYYVFQTTQVSFLQINARGYTAALYDKDVRFDSLQFATIKPLQPCSSVPGFIQFCFFQPGTYTLVIFADNSDLCKSVAPQIYIDQIGTSRFDYAINAYDFGVVPADSSYHYGKLGDVNPINSARKASSDIFYCTTGASTTDPTNPVCQTVVNPNVYNNGPNKPLYDSAFPPSKGITRRNLWYTFVVNHPGTVKVKVESKTLQRGYQQKFSVYQSNVDGSMPFSSVISNGEVDSTVAQGLRHIVTNPQGYYYCQDLPQEVSFYRDPCTSVPTRYYVLVENVNAEPYESGGTLPNTQADVSIFVDSVYLILTKYDHYSQAGDFGNVGVGTFTAGVDNYSCATRDIPDPIYYYNNTTGCNKTIWYKFTSTITGNVRYRIFIDGVRKQDYYDVQLFRQTIAGDSTSNGLEIQYYTVALGADNTYWAQTCVSPGTYYLLLPGCGQVGASVYPEIQLTENTGDFCTRPAVSALNGAGAVSASVLVNCHTIGTDYGEFGPQLTCPQGAVTANYKSSWFRMDIGGTDTLDVTTYLVENTNAASSDIKYRLMTGNCGAMQEQSCVLDALTQNTYQCLVPGKSYYVQVFTPLTKFNQVVTGTIDLKLSAVAHRDTCAPLNNCLANANFISQFNCNTDTAVRFVNYSTFGSSIQFEWDFGYNGQTSNAVSPIFNYPALSTAATYNVKLKVQNTSCGGRDSIVNTITIPARPNIQLGNDTVRCSTPATIVLNANTWPGTTYLWSTGATTPTINASTTGTTRYWVNATFNGCSSSDTVRVHINPITPRKQSLVKCPNVDSLQIVSTRNQGETHAWSNGQTTSSIWVYDPGTYYNRMNWNGCIIIDTFIILPPNNPFPKDTSFCLRSPATLNATSPGATSYQWQNGASGPTFTITTAGLYWVQINYPNCNVRDSVTVSPMTPVSKTLSASICSGEGYTLPSGIVVYSAGTYYDTARAVAGCDSVISAVVISVRSGLSQSSSASICAGENYTLPWGTVVNSTGMYSDTIKYSTGICDSLIRTVTLNVRAVLRNNNVVTLCTGQTYTLPSGTNVSTTGVYLDTLRYRAGCDSVISTTNISVKTLLRNSSAVKICEGQSHTLPSGIVVNTAGTYSDTLRYPGGCDSLISVTNIAVQPVLRRTLNSSICAGQSYTLPSGLIVNNAGVYRDTIRFSAGCDSLISVLTLTIRSVQRSTSNVSICAGQTYTLPSGLMISTAGIYLDTLKYAAGCDSLITTVNLRVKSLSRTSLSSTICPGESYTLPSGIIVSTVGTFSDTIRYSSGCDSIITTVVLSQRPVSRLSKLAIICQGQSYTLPSGLVVYNAATYLDTLRYGAGCDSLINTITLAVQTTLRSNSNPVICAGQTYTLASGIIVSAAGIYPDTVRYNSGCDSLIRTTNLSVKTLSRVNSQATICQGQSYTLPSGLVVSTGGTYHDTLRYVSGCDSIITTVVLSLRPVNRLSRSVTICQGQSYTLPSGLVVYNAATYLDTLRYNAGCDSLINTITLAVQPIFRSSSNAVICAGQTYTLPSGIIVSSAGVYLDTVKYNSGCDSLIRTTNLSVRIVSRVNSQATICQGQSYTLPSGINVSTSGIYRDTLRYISGCDSVIATINLSVKSVTGRTATASVCQGQSYTLPSGTVITNGGIYADTLKYSNACDSIITMLTLSVKSLTRRSSSTTICAGQTYTLPSGTIISSAGTYVDTIRYVTGCDSLISTVTISQKTLLRANANPVICQGQFYTTPSGITISVQGNYSDTVRYNPGCDSLITTINLSVRSVSQITLSAVICAGQTYTLPSGIIINTAGIYKDTLRYRTGCDSVVSTINLSIKAVNRTILNPSICAGQFYTLPSGTVVNSAGAYSDTLRYGQGCDSLISTIILSVKTLLRVTSSASLCQGQTFTLPSGTVVSSAGTYLDTLKYSSGCDSLISTITLRLQLVSRNNVVTSICQGQSYTLPSGTIIFTSGIYNDTLKYRSGCDSLITTINLQVTGSPVRINLNPSICAGQSYTLPSGTTVNSSGTYISSIKNLQGCDSIITTINLMVNANPVVNITKSNDVNCIIGSGRLTATGGTKYSWSPQTGLSNPQIANPEASPNVTTTYTVKVSNVKGCSTSANIEVKVNKGNGDGGYLLPTAFTPNGDNLNDCFGINAWGAVTELRFTVFNRWGNVIFNTTEPGRCWDGKYLGALLDVGAYTYVISANTLCGPIVRKGTVMLLK